MSELGIRKERIESRLNVIYELSRSDKIRKDNMLYYQGCLDMLKLLGIQVKRTTFGVHKVTLPREE